MHWNPSPPQNLHQKKWVKNPLKSSGKPQICLKTRSRGGPHAPTSHGCRPRARLPRPTPSRRQRAARQTWGHHVMGRGKRGEKRRFWGGFVVLTAALLGRTDRRRGCAWRPSASLSSSACCEDGDGQREERCRKDPFSPQKWARGVRCSQPIMSPVHPHLLATSCRICRRNLPSPLRRTWLSSCTS